MTTKLETEANDGKGDDQVKLLVETLDGRANGVFANEFECRKYVVRVIDSLRNTPTYRMAEHVPQRTVARDYDPQCEEFTLEVASSEWDKALFDLVDKSFVSNRLFAEAGRPDIRSTLQLPLFSVLQRKFIAYVNDIPMSGFSFGNQRDPFHFTTHIKFEENEANINILNEKENFENKGPIVADFEHDRDQVAVRFGFFEKRETGPPFIACAQLRILYSNIRRIIVNWSHLDGDILHKVNIYLRLDAPVECRISQKRQRVFGVYERSLSWSEAKAPARVIADCPTFRMSIGSIFRQELYDIISRMRTRCKVMLDFCPVLDEAGPIPPPRVCPPMADPNTAAMITQTGCHEFVYLIEALSSRGAMVNDHILKDTVTRFRFVDTLTSRFYECPRVTIEALERLLNTIDEKVEIRNLDHVFQKLYDKALLQEAALELTEKEKAKCGLQRVRKVIITPTRVHYVVPELLMGNRFLRKHNKLGFETLRIQFRDDNGKSLYVNSVGEKIIKATVEGALYNGLRVGGTLYKYMGSSNSQMRDNGCYFFNADDPAIQQRIWAEFGRFDMKNIPKFMSRFGQCFTQARKSNVQLERSMYRLGPDLIGGDDQNGDAYVFSDGVGNVSLEYARRISKDLDLRGCVPSVFQIRFRGIKGIISVNPFLDSLKEFFTENNDIDQGSSPLAVNIVFRWSQEKFAAPRANGIEVVKFSMPVPVTLNRPMIQIIDQVSLKQNASTHKRISRRVNELQKQQLESLATSLIDEEKAHERLNGLPRRIDYGFLSRERGFLITEEPFFRSLLECCVQYTVGRLVRKNQVEIPAKLGRMLFGVIDESGLLQYGQIFCQVTTNIQQKLPGPSGKKQVLEGPVLMTKNPAIVAGDVRMFQAVNIPELRHLVDVVVFPRYGPRPHSDEMAGSDLDGDEYVVIWDPELFLEHSETPFVFPKPVKKSDGPDDRDVMTRIVQFYTSYVLNDAVGRIATSFLAQSDQHGIDSDLCLAIAEKHSLAVDFPKTGKAPARLTRIEQPQRFPDFMERIKFPTYISTSLNGQLYRRSRHIDLIISQAQDLQITSPLKADPDMVYKGYESYLEKAMRDSNCYNSNLSALLENYGIADEAQAFTGMISKCRNRISDRDNDDMSLFNTNYVIEQRLNEIFRNAREQFFVEFGGYEHCTVDDASYRSGRKLQKTTDDNDTNRRYCKYPTDAMKKKASAYYWVCYAIPSRTESRFLSFAWVCWDILSEIKKEAYMRKEFKIQGVPLHARLHEYILNYSNSDEVGAEFREYKEELREYQGFAAPYAEAFEGLDELFFILQKWADMHNLLNYEFSHECLNALLILHGVDAFRTSDSVVSSVWLGEIPSDNKKLSLLDRVGGLGLILLNFLKFLGSTDFRQRGCVSLSPLECHEFLPISTCNAVSKAAHDTYYAIVISASFGTLPQARKVQSTRRRLHELDPFTIELPDSSQLDPWEITQNVKKLSGVDHLTMRKIRTDHQSGVARWIVSAAGTLTSLEALRNLVTVEPNMSCRGKDLLSKARIMADMVYDKIRPTRPQDIDAQEARLQITPAKIAMIGTRQEPPHRPSGRT